MQSADTKIPTSTRLLDQPMTEETAQAVMLALRAGRTLNSICSKRRANSEWIAYRSCFRIYCTQHPEYAVEANALQAANWKKAQKRKGEQKRNQTTCKRGHSLADAYTYVSREGWVMRYCRACHRMGVSADMTPAEVRRVTAAVKAGLKIHDITHSTPTRRLIVGFAKLRQYRIAHPEFDRFIIENSRDLRSSAALRRCRIVPANAKFEYGAPAIIKPARKDIPPFLMQDDDMAWVLSLIPRSVPDHARYDVVQDVFMALSACEISREEVPEMVRKQAAKYIVRESDGRDPTKPWSLDVPAYREGSMLRAETVSVGMWD